ncbi:hypothetical protein [Rhizobium oryzicola]|uniref:Uncharacterized protein n=1 Tax=Rhizobium oryzicola TaxID=1232668 RepID=A0ABT8SVC9_9HYPH|nr:hypothetical protein [Rhizobium oryzicola]MDO1582399.1 hypothetical protein [Rhizobium oryzicola]
MMSTVLLTPSDVERIRELVFAGYTTEEIARQFNVTADHARNFMTDHGISRMIDLHDPKPQPDLSRPDKVIIYHLRPAANSGTRHVSRISLPRLSFLHGTAQPERATP